MKALKWILGVVVVLAAIILIWGAIIPKTYYGEASTVINQPAMMLYQSVAGFENRAQWDPWVETEPTAEVSITTEWENDFIGSEYHWNGEVIGTGMMRVDSVILGKKIYNSIFFGGSNKASLVTWDFVPVDNGTKVTWGLSTELAYPVERIVFTLMGKGMIRSFEKGLENLKNITEAKETRSSYYHDVEYSNIEAFNAVVSRGEASMAEMPQVMDQLYGSIMRQIQRQKLTVSGMPFTFYDDPASNQEPYRFYAGFTVNEISDARGGTEPMSFAAQKVFSLMHTGPYDELEYTYAFAMKYIEENQIPVSGQIIEFYYNKPGEVAPVDLITKIVFLLQVQ